MDNFDSNIPPRRQKSKRRIWPAVLLIFCFLGAAIAGAMVASSSLGILDPKHNPISQLERENTETELIKVKDKTTVLIMGVDVRENDVGRSDTMMIATIDPQLDKASLLSVPRDTRVRISGYGFDKINAAYAYGGEPLSEKTVENLLGIDIDHYVIINTKSFVKIIDAIGGVDIEVEKRMYYEDPWDDDGGLYIDLQPGLQHMDGKTAVTYVRYRDGEGDIGRIHRQQKFMEACMNKIVSPDIITKIPSVVREIIDAIETDMTFRQILELAGALKAAQSNGLTTEMVPGYPLYIEGISYWMPDVEELRLAVAAGLGVNVDSQIQRRASETASEYQDSIPETASDIPDGSDRIGRPIRNSDDYSNARQFYDRQSREDYNNNLDSRTQNYDYNSNFNYDAPRYDSQAENSRTENLQIEDNFDEVPSRENTSSKTRF